MNIRNYVLIGLVVILMISGCVEEKPDSKTGNGVNVTNAKEILFETVDIGVARNNRNKSFFIIMNEPDFHKLGDTNIYISVDVDGELKKFSRGMVDLSKIDFKDYFVIATISRDINLIKIEKINQIGNILTLVVEIELCRSQTLPATESLLPYHIIKIKKSELSQRGNLTFIFVDQKENELHRENVEIL